MGRDVRRLAETPRRRRRAAIVENAPLPDWTG